MKDRKMHSHKILLYAVRAMFIENGVDWRTLEDRFAAYWAMVSADGAVAPNPNDYTPEGSNL